MAASGSAKKSTALNDAVLEAARPKTRSTETATAAPEIDITANPFYNVLFDQSLKMDEKQARVTELTTSTLDRKKDREAVKAYDEFREWLSAQQTALAKNIIDLSNVDSMAELQSVLKDMNEDLLSFEDKMNPIMEIIESIHHLRTNGLMGDAFRQIKEDQQREDEAQAEMDRLVDDMEAERESLRALIGMKAELENERSFFGLGGITTSAKARIAQCEQQMTDIRNKVDGYQARHDELKKQLQTPAQDGDDTIHMQRLRELLDMSRDENRDRVVALRDAASSFITTAEQRTGSLRGQFDSLSEQIVAVEDSNQNMLKVYAVLNDGMKDANAKNTALREGLAEATEDESTVQKMTREEQLRALDTHVDHMSRSQGETMASYGDLNQQAIRVHTMRESTDQQMDTARQINTQGVAATADRLATVLTAVSGAALGEASEAARDTLDQMRQSTNDISSREVIRVAMGTSQINDQLETVFKDLEDIREVQQAATGITRNGMAEMRERMSKLKETAEGAKKDLQDHIASASTVGQEAEVPKQHAKPAPTTFPGV